MFGKNERAENETRLPGASLKVMEVFPTIQGEGPLAGMPAVFIRLAGCNLACHYCDTYFSGGQWLTVDAILDAVGEAADGYKLPLIVITGGEPMRQNIGPLVRRLHWAGETIQIETAGTLWPPELPENAVSIVCSPKTKSIHPTVARCCRHFKYIIGDDDFDPSDGMPKMSTQHKGMTERLYRPPAGSATVWLQPRMDYLEDGLPDEARNRQNLLACVDQCKKHGHRLSLQQHKIIGLP